MILDVLFWWKWSSVCLFASLSSACTRAQDHQRPKVAQSYTIAILNYIIQSYIVLDSTKLYCMLDTTKHYTNETTIHYTLYAIYTSIQSRLYSTQLNTICRIDRRNSYTQLNKTQPNPNTLGPVILDPMRPYWAVCDFESFCISYCALCSYTRHIV